MLNSIQYDNEVSNAELGQIRATSRHQVQASINASSYSNNRRQALEQQMTAVTQRAQSYVQGNSRSTSLGQVAMRQTEQRANVQTMHHERAYQAHRHQAQQRQSVFERLGPQQNREQQQPERSQQRGREQGR